MPQRLKPQSYTKTGDPVVKDYEKDSPETIDELLDAIRSLDCWGCGCCSYGTWESYPSRESTKYVDGKRVPFITEEVIGDKEKVRRWVENLVQSAVQEAKRAN